MSQINSGDGRKPRPCRKCGGEITIEKAFIVSSGECYAFCKECGPMGRLWDTEQEAIFNWNKLKSE
jgi:hypothetical protein